MTAALKIIFMAGLLALLSGCAYDPAYPYNASNSYYGYGGSGFRSPYYGSSYGSGYRNGYYNTGYPGYGHYNRGYGRYCPDDD
jgi:hypothetical protein